MFKQSGLVGLNASECSTRGELFESVLKENNKTLSETVYIIHSQHEAASKTLPPRWIGELGKSPFVSRPLEFVYSFAEGTHDGLLSYGNQTGGLYRGRVQGEAIYGNHMDVHTLKRPNNPNVEYLKCQDTNEYPFFCMQGKLPEYLIWGYNEEGTACEAEKAYSFWSSNLRGSFVAKSHSE